MRNATDPEAEPPPRFVAGGCDAELYGVRAGYPKGDRATYLEVGSLVGSHSHLDEIFETRRVHKASTASRLVRVDEPSITWRWENAELTLDDYLARHPTTGLLVALGDRILVERYQYGRTDRDRLISWSMGKTVTAMLIGIALQGRLIRSIDDPAAAYVPGLAGCEYGRTSLRHLLQMSSGVRFTEDYSGADDFARLRESTIRLNGPGGVSAVTEFNERAAPAGTRFSYSSAETQVLGLVLTGATGRPVAEYLEQKIWQPMGAEADATWLIDNAGQEVAVGGLNAVLRDYARLGLMLAHDGHWRDRQIIPAEWLMEATTVRRDQPHLRPGVATPVFGYGYQTWIVPVERRMFLLWGVRGQRIIVDPRSKLVIVNTAVHQQAIDLRALEEMWAVWWAFVKRFGG
jgi:CubicO group peptidase (beta-lactamase class C family)